MSGTLARMSRHSPHIPWRTAGRVSDQMATADEVVRETGWVFNNETGDAANLAEFVATGDDEVPAYLEYSGCARPTTTRTTLVEIGSGIGRMTCALHPRVRHGGRLRPRRRLPRALPRDGRPVRQGRPAAHGPRRRRPHARPPRRLRRPRVQLHHAPALPARRRPRAGDRGRAGRPARRPDRAQLPYWPAASDVVVARLAAVVRALFRIPALGDRLSRTRGFARLGLAGQPAAPRPGDRSAPPTA